MSKGFLILAQNNSSDNYVKMAYVLALTIKISQSKYKNVSLVTDIVDAVPNHYRTAFDHIISIPWYDDALETEWKIENRWKLYHVTPYDETIILDADMLMLTDITHWWEYFEMNYDVFITSNVVTYRNELVTNDYYRKAFVYNDLPNLYSALMYFKKTPFSKEFWDTVEMVAKNWKDFYSIFMKNHKPNHLSMDVVFALTVKILDIESIVTSPVNHITFTHMKGQIQNWKNPVDEWNSKVGIYFNNRGSLKIENYQQSGLFHYTDKKFISKRMLYVYEELHKELIK